MFKKSLSIVMLAGLLCGEALAQTVKSPTPNQPASLTITPTTLPEVLQVLDNTGTWVPMGSINSTKHSFTAYGGEADILVTDPTIGMAANNGQDNSPFVAALMAKQMPAAWGGYDVLFPGIPGQTETVYYFANTFVNQRVGNYHCSGSGVGGYQGVWLVFAAGVDGFLEESNTLTPDGSLGGGELSACYIVSLGYGYGVADTANPTVLTQVRFNYNFTGVGVPLSSWHVGDGVLMSTTANAFFALGSEFPVPIGTTVTAINPTTGDLTLSNPIPQSLGNVFQPKATATFTQTGTNNFSVGDIIKIGPTTYTFGYNVAYGAGPTAVLIGTDFTTSVNNLLNAVNGGNGRFVTYAPPINGTYAFQGDPLFRASYASGVITFTSGVGAPDTNTQPSIYTPATGTLAGAFGGATFSGADPSLQIGMALYQLPKTQEFKIVTQPTAAVINGYIAGNNLTVTLVQSGTITIGQPLVAANGSIAGATYITGGSGTSWTVNKSQTAGSSSSPIGIYAGGPYISVISGPRLLQPNDVIWSDAFSFGATLNTRNGTVGAQTISITDAADTGTLITPTITHAPGAEGSLWVLPAGIKRRAPSKSNGNFMSGWPIGLLMACNTSGADVNCDESKDMENSMRQNFVGRWVSGDNTATATSMNDEWSGNFLMDAWEGGTLGEIYYNADFESPESAASRYGIVQNCANQNYTMVFGAYMSGNPGCSNGEWMYPAQYGGVTVFGTLAAGPANYGAPALNRKAFYNGMDFWGGPDQTQCVSVSGPASSWWAIMFSNGGCGIGNILALNWNPYANTWAWFFDFPGSGGVMQFFNHNWGSVGYLGQAQQGVYFPFGIVVGDAPEGPNYARSITAGITPDIGYTHINGDIQINAAAPPGGTAAWYSSPIFTTTMIDASTGHVAACPTTPIPFQSEIVDSTPAVPFQAGLLQSCVGTTLTWNEYIRIVNNGDTIQFMMWIPIARVPNDIYGISSSVSALTSVANVLSYAPCSGDTTIGVATVVDGQTVAAAGYNAPMGTGGGSTRRLVFCDGTSWTYH